jgi:AraC family transcriptional regulator
MNPAADWLGRLGMGVAAASAPVSLGARRTEHRDVPGFAVRRLDFPPDLSLPTHDHRDATIAVVLRGRFEGRWAWGNGTCAPGALIVEPAGAQHSNHFGPDGAVVVTVQPSPSLAAALNDPSRALSPEALALAWRAASELRVVDDLTPIALEGLSLELLAIARRAAAPSSKAAAWLDRATEIVEEQYARPLALRLVAAEVGVHPVHLARGFRAHHGRSVGTYLREVRVRRAAARLANGDESIAQIALAVGFADQSHLHRWFVRLIGQTPARYRRQLRGD